MDLQYALFSMKQGLLGIAFLVAPIPLLACAAKDRRKLIAFLPCIAAILLFIVSCLIAGLTTRQSPSYVIYIHLAANLGCVILTVPSTLALRGRVVGALLHLSTFVGLVLTWFVGGMALTHDWL